MKNQNHNQSGSVMTGLPKPLKIIILAAGKGNRLRSESSDLPKVLREAAGRPLLRWVTDHVDFVRPEEIILVVGYQAERVNAEMGDQFTYVLQKEQLGTGHAAAAAAEELKDYQGDVLVVYGDMPLIKKETYLNLVLSHQSGIADCTMLTARAESKLAYGRIIRDQQGRFQDIVEQKDCNQEQLEIREVNPGVYVFRSPLLFKMLGRLKNDNAQSEYYLTDVPKLVLQAGYLVETHMIDDEQQILGVNTQEDLDTCSRLLGEAQV